ncbi:hypothetical protein Hypma_000063 [Hypsizygus marmoreus]|uniref:Uncharacterized protein n=1 Tax=Hypsizygus marmoreus TaxID=39966 RepID=A0A369KC02_HYPMA|nr:hypothetical protein Hypma_000063 [Hypsizygus marmoreus]
MKFKIIPCHRDLRRFLHTDMALPVYTGASILRNTHVTPNQPILTWDSELDAIAIVLYLLYS